MRRPPPTLLLFLLLALVLGREVVTGFKICSYNLQGFGPKKAANYRVLHTMTRVVSRCDICLLQNVIDPDGKAMKNLLSVLNRYERNRFVAVTSKGLGNASDDMQQYVYIYRSQVVTASSMYQYSSKKVFLRDPFVVRFKSNKTDIKDFILVPLHSDPDNVVTEVDKLYDVFVDVSQKWNNTNVMFLGDFHTACGYITRMDKRNIRLFTNSSFIWMIKDRDDTTVDSKAACAYDRIVVYGGTFLKAIEPFSAKAFNFGEHFKLSMAKVLEVSDHLPVEVTLKGAAPLLQATPLLVLGVWVVLQSFLSASVLL
ncbi:deoxyribonuclease-1-like 2 isoform X2 [Betta splendens]|uniref:Deoxyribonuclease n=1 Tax=Betta splendens TaxID=158456 RepID=A0A6P7N2K8_BETSP|nr:deoxyribonuclease-1-like 2 isoform X2 [Betta splendens]